MAKITKAEQARIDFASTLPGRRSDEAWTDYTSRVRPIVLKGGYGIGDVFKFASMAKGNNPGRAPKATSVKATPSTKATKAAIKPVPKATARQSSSPPAPRRNGNAAPPAARGTSTRSGAQSPGRRSTQEPERTGRAMRVGEVRGQQMCPICGLHPENPKESAINRQVRCIFAQAQKKGRPVDLATIAKAAGVKNWAARGK